jgi:hypothetical protein
MFWDTRDTALVDVNAPKAVPTACRKEPQAGSRTREVWTQPDGEPLCLTSEQIRPPVAIAHSTASSQNCTPGYDTGTSISA